MAKDFFVYGRIHFNEENIKSFMRDVGMDNDDEEYDDEELQNAFGEFELDEILSNFDNDGVDVYFD